MLTEIRADLALTGTVAGLVTTLPLICFGVCGLAAPPLAARVGLRRSALLAMLAVTAGLAVRVLTDSTVVFVAATTVALAGSGVANVLCPALVKLHFPDRISLVIGVYSTLMQLSTALAAATSVPIAAAFGGWRAALGIWALMGLIAALPWLGLLRERAPVRHREHAVTARRLARSRTAWCLTLFFGLQSANGYAQLGWLPAILRDAGIDQAAAGYALSLLPGVGMVVSVLLAAVTARLRSLRPLVVAIMICYVAGYTGLLVAPGIVPVVWAVLLGIGNGVFPVALILIGLRARTGQGSSALSGFVQGIGYFVAAAGPFLIGVLHDVTGTWTVPVAVLLASILVLFALGLAVTRIRYVEDEIT